MKVTHCGESFSADGPAGFSYAAAKPKIVMKGDERLSMILDPGALENTRQ